MKTDYIITLPDGSQTTMEVTNQNMPQFNMDGLIGAELEEACASLFSNLGWDVKKETIITLEKGVFRPDIELSDGGKVYGYVEVVTSMEPKDLVAKQQTIKVIMDKCKPELFVLTNGIIFDIFYNGNFAGTQSVPPTPETLKEKKRLTAYANALLKMHGGTNDD